MISLARKPRAVQERDIQAAIRLGRKFVGVERNAKYFALAVERLRAEESGSSLQAARAHQAPLFGGRR